MRMFSVHFKRVLFLLSLLLMTADALAQYSRDRRPPGYGSPGHGPAAGVIAESSLYIRNGNVMNSERFVITTYGQLEQYQSVNGGRERRHEVSRPLGEFGQLIDVAAMDSGSGTVSVFVLNRQGEIEQYMWSLYTNWERHLLTRGMNGPRLRNLQQAVNSGGQFVISGQDSRGRLIRYIWEPHTGWYVL